MLVATLLALGAAVLHAGWNLAIKQARGGGDRFLALWAQFSMAALLSAAVLVAVGGMPASGVPWAAVSGLVHLPYCWFLAHAYDHGDFSLVYPIARGGGALLAAAGGVLLLGDHLAPLSAVAIVVVASGLLLLAGRGRGPGVGSALLVAGTIAVYSVADARGVRVAGARYALGSFVGTAVTTTAFGLATGRAAAMADVLRTSWRRSLVAGAAVAVTYGMVQLAFQRAPVGYVTALRESSVVLATVAGARMLSEPVGRRRAAASVVVVAGLVLLVASR